MKKKAALFRRQMTAHFNQGEMRRATEIFNYSINLWNVNAFVTATQYE